MKPLFPILASLIISASISADEPRRAAVGDLEIAAAEYLVTQFEYISCDNHGYIYGVGYIDESYMERILIVKDPPGGTPELNVEFRGEEMTLVELTPAEEEQGIPTNSTTVQFMLDLTVNNFNDAVFKKNWELTGEGLRGSPRFSHTSWFGEIYMVGERWIVDWQGYRKPMLPASVSDNADKICALFAASQHPR